MQSELRKLPSIDTLLQSDGLASLITRHGRQVVLTCARTELAAVRQHILSGRPALSPDALIRHVSERVQQQTRPSLQPVINATGIIVHTNLGRALLSERAQTAMQQVAAAYLNLEYDLDAGTRGSRYIHAADLLCRLSGAEAAVVVNNNAAAVVLALTVLAGGKEVVISRGQLVEIGGGFRVPDIMAQSGGTLVEVGTTNRTYGQDFERAIGPNTGLLLSVHASNYHISGFTAQPSLAELAELAQARHIPLMEDLGSGTLLDTASYGLAHEPTIQESVVAGVDVVTASGDKLLGGPQAGLIFGKKAIIDRLKKHPLIRALRVDKTTLAALQATLLAYLEERAVDEIPVWRMISARPPVLARRARKWRSALQNRPQLAHIPMQVIRTVSAVGGGSLPGQTLPTQALALEVEGADALAERLRRSALHTPVIARIENNRLLLDPRTVLPEQDAVLAAALTAAMLEQYG